MVQIEQPTVAIVDYGLGNIFSIRQACKISGLEPTVTARPEDLFSADAVILPGVGAFGDAMAALRKLDLVQPLLDLAKSDKPLLGICLGMQLLMSESSEFGRHEGLGIIPGNVERLDHGEGVQPMKVPLVGWNKIVLPSEIRPGGWSGTILDGISDAEFMYFVHSYYVYPEDRLAILANTEYAGMRFCSALQVGSVTGLQFHPERSATQGLKVYANLCNQLSGPEFDTVE